MIYSALFQVNLWKLCNILDEWDPGKNYSVREHEWMGDNEIREYIKVTELKRSYWASGNE